MQHFGPGISFIETDALQDYLARLCDASCFWLCLYGSEIEMALTFRREEQRSPVCPTSRSSSPTRPDPMIPVTTRRPDSMIPANRPRAYSQ